MKETFTDRKTGRILSQVNQDYYRPSDVVYLRGDYSKIEANLGWKPQTSLDELAEIMTSFDLGLVSGTTKDYGI